MTTDLILSQLADPFRIVLLAGLVLTQRRTEGATGLWIPLAAGVVFVAVLLPMTTAAGEAGMTTAIVAGLVSNVLLLIPILGAFALWDRSRRP